MTRPEPDAAALRAAWARIQPACNALPFERAAPLLQAAKHYGVDVAQFTLQPAEEKAPGKAKAKKLAKKARGKKAAPAAAESDDELQDGDAEQVGDEGDE